MQDDRCEALMRYFLEGGAEESGESLICSSRNANETKFQGTEPSAWTTVRTCLKRIRRWRVPPHWSERDWYEEVLGEVTLAVIQAANDFDVSRGIPFGAFLHRRILYTALGRYRREWTYAIHRISEVAVDEYEAIKGAEYPSRESIADSLREAVTHLSTSDASLIEGLFWEGKSEASVAQTLGITQQAVNKRKHTIFKHLDAIIKLVCPQITP